MRPIQEIFNIAIYSGRYRPRSGMCGALIWLWDKGVITVEEHGLAREAIMEFMKDLPSAYLWRGLISISRKVLSRVEAEEICFKIYRNWDQRYEIIKEMQS